jgi:hypothetical protein
VRRRRGDRGEIDVDDYHQRIAALAGTSTTGGNAVEG